MKKDLKEQEDELRYEDFLEQYRGNSLHVLVEKREELRSTVGSDPVELQAVLDLIEESQCDMDMFADYRR